MPAINKDDLKVGAVFIGSADDGFGLLRLLPDGRSDPVFGGVGTEPGVCRIACPRGTGRRPPG